MKIITVAIDSLVHELPVGATIIGAYYNSWSSTYSVDLWLVESKPVETRKYEFRIFTAHSDLKGNDWTLPVAVKDSIMDEYATWRYVE